MSLQQKIRHYWHDLYYALSGTKGTEFAMRCKDVAEEIDLKQTPPLSLARMRFYLHLSLCQACKNYFDTGRALRRALRQLVHKSRVAPRVHRLNQELLKKYASIKKSQPTK